MPQKSSDRIPGWQGNEGDPASGLGAQLRARREAQGWSLTAVAEWLRIRESYLQALEDGNPSVFPGSAYALGFLRTYAQALGLDPDEAVARFRHETRGVFDRKPELSFPEPVSERGVPVGLWVGAGLAVLVGTYIGYYHFFGADPAPTRRMPPVAEIMPGVTQHGTPSPQIAAVMPDRGGAPSPETPSRAAPNAPDAQAPVGSGSSPGDDGLPDAPSLTGSSAASQAGSGTGGASPAEGAAGDNPAGNSSPGDNPLGNAPGTGAGTGAGTDAGAGQAGQPGAGTAPGTKPDGMGPGGSGSDNTAPDSAAAAVSPDAVRLHAQADAWVQIRDKTGATVFSRVLKAGESWTGEAADAPYRMTLGNAGGLTLSAGDVTTGALGRNGAVRRNLVVTPEAVREGRLGQETVRPAGDAAEQGGAGPGGNVARDDATSETQSAVAVPHPPLKRPVPAPKAGTSSGESETDRLNARQLERTAQPR